MEPKKTTNKFHIEFLHPSQRLAYSLFQQHDIIIMLGSPGTGKTHLATAFAINEVLKKQKKRIILTRPIVEAGESLGFLPGDFHEKVHPYMLPFFDCIRKVVGEKGPQRDFINNAIEIAPLAYLRGRSLEDSVCILDEAQNCTTMQLKLFLTRMGTGSKMIITADPNQSDISNSGLRHVVEKLSNIIGIGTITFTEEAIVRHPLVAEICKVL